MSGLNAFMTIHLSLLLQLPLLQLIITGVFAAGDWHYGEEKHWPPLCKHGKKQSPIGLSEEIAQEREFSAFIFENYNRQYQGHLKNNGHSAEIRLPVQDQPKIRGGGLPEVYILDHLHFHWQSEHVIEEYRFPLELHLVHYASIYHNLSNALRHPNGVAVFSVLFDLSPDDDREFEPLIAVIDKLHDKVDTIEKMNINILDFIPRDKAGFYRYNGSLTTPDCTEGVTWTIFTNTLPISNHQVNSFATLQTREHKGLRRNFRGLQDLNDRDVYLKKSPIHSSGNRNYLSIYCLVILVQISFYSKFLLNVM